MVEWEGTEEVKNTVAQWESEEAGPKDEAKEGEVWAVWKGRLEQDENLGRGLEGASIRGRAKGSDTRNSWAESSRFKIAAGATRIWEIQVLSNTQVEYLVNDTAMHKVYLVKYDVTVSFMA